MSNSFDTHTTLNVNGKDYEIHPLTKIVEHYQNSGILHYALRQLAA